MPHTLRALGLALMLATAGPALADEPTSDELRSQAKDIRGTAEQTYLVTTYHCYDKFLVNACLDDAKIARIEQIKEARALEAKANTMDRRLRVKAMEARLRKVDPASAAAPASNQ